MAETDTVVEEKTEVTVEEKPAVDPIAMPREELEKLLREPVTEPEEEVIEKDDTGKSAEKGEKETVDEKAPVEGEKLNTEELDAIKAENEKLKNAVQNQDKLLARLGTEVGLLRKTTPEQERAELEEIRDIYREDPIEGQKLLEEYKGRKAQEESIIQQHQILQQSVKTRELMLSSIPQFEESLADIANLLAEDGANAETVQVFKQNPYLFGREVLLNLHKRNVAVKELSNQKSELERLRAENEQLRKKPDEMLRKIEKVSSVKTESAKSGGSNNKSTITGDKPVYAMSREELRKVVHGG